jgi:hypothetical protein
LREDSNRPCCGGLMKWPIHSLPAASHVVKK